MTNEQKLALLSAFKVYTQALAESKRMLTRAELYNFRTNGTDIAGYTKRISKARAYQIRAMKAFQATARKVFSWRVETVWDGVGCVAVTHKERGKDIPDHLVFGTPSTYTSKAALLKHIDLKEKAVRPLRAKLAHAETRRSEYVMACAELELEYQRLQYEIDQIRNAMTKSPYLGIDNLSGADRRLHAGIAPLQKQRHRVYIALPRKQRELARIDERIARLKQEIGI